MKLYRVYNGYTGDTAVHVIVIAESIKQAEELASTKFKEDCKDERYIWPLPKEEPWPKEEYYRYPESYWTNLKVELLSDNVNKPYISDVES